MALLDLQGMEEKPSASNAKRPNNSGASKGCAPSGLSLLLC
jgi:hypothetical protein